jgi:hypothetical protein
LTYPKQIGTLVTGPHARLSDLLSISNEPESQMPRSTKSTTVILNDFGGQRRTRQRSGKAYFTVSITAEPLVHHFDTRRLGQPVADAMALVIRDGIRGIKEQAAPSTIARRAKARIAWAAGVPWARAQYRDRMPGRTTKLFNDSRTLADGIAVKPNRGKDGGWLIVFPPNRFDPLSPGSPPEHVLRRQLDRLVRVVPEFDPAKLVKATRVRKALEESVTLLIERAKRGKR